MLWYQFSDVSFDALHWNIKYLWTREVGLCVRHPALISHVERAVIVPICSHAHQGKLNLGCYSVYSWLLFKIFNIFKWFFFCNLYPLTKIGDWEVSCCIVYSPCLWLSLCSCVRTASLLLRNSSCHKCGWAGWHLKLGFITAKGKIGFHSHWQVHDWCWPLCWPGIMKEWKTFFFYISKSITDAIEVWWWVQALTLWWSVSHCLGSSFHLPWKSLSNLL